MGHAENVQPHTNLPTKHSLDVENKKAVLSQENKGAMQQLFVAV